MKTNDLEERIKNNYAGNYYGNQHIRSSGSPSLNYNREARSAEPHNCLKANLYTGNHDKINWALDENNLFNIDFCC